MYDLRILLIWFILGFLLYLIARKPESEKVADRESGEIREYSEVSFFPYSFTPRESDTVIRSRLRETRRFISKIKPGDFLANRAACMILPKELIISRGVFPIRVEGDKIVLAMIDPFDLDTVDEVRELTGREIHPVEIARKDFNNVIKCLDDF